MQLETLEFVIYPDGRVQEKVTGVIGASCAEVTAAIEEKLGRVLSQEQTSEFYSVSSHQLSHVANQTSLQASFSEWYFRHISECLHSTSVCIVFVQRSCSFISHIPSS